MLNGLEYSVVYKEQPDINTIAIKDDDKAKGLRHVLQCIEPNEDSGNYPTKEDWLLKVQRSQIKTRRDMPYDSDSEDDRPKRGKVDEDESTYLTEKEINYIVPYIEDLIKCHHVLVKSKPFYGNNTVKHFAVALIKLSLYDEMDGYMWE